MLKMKGTACIEASVQRTWEALSDLEKISDWSEVILSSTCNGDQKRGVGAERVCSLKNNVTIIERVLEWNEGESFTYEGFNLPLVNRAKNTWSVKEVNGKTLLTTESELVLKGGVLGRILEPIMFFMAKKMGADSIAALKYLVENGAPYTGRHSVLPRAAVSC